MTYRRVPLFFVLLFIMCLSGSLPAQEPEPLVGLYYYPWYGAEEGHGFDTTLRMHLRPAQKPASGLYDSGDEDIISDHIDQSKRAGADVWALSWWGPGSYTDRVIRKHILTHPRVSELKYVIHYETTGRLGTAYSPDYSNLVEDFRYLARHYFNHDRYLKFDGRPVVILYVTRAFFNASGAADAVSNLRRTIQDEFGFELFLIGDDLFRAGIKPKRARLWDAVTSFDVYGMSLKQHSATPKGLRHLKQQYSRAREKLQEMNIGFVPGATPGFNDRGVREGHEPVPRYMTVNGERKKFGSLFRRMLKQVVRPTLDPSTNRMVLINSFNEWHEDTQIEPTVDAPPTKSDDKNGYYTRGHRYEGYGTTYLDILRNALRSK